MTDAHARPMEGYADQWIPRYISEELERELAGALEQLAAMTDQRDAALMVIRLAQRTAGED